jgi:hypothetical protein
VGAEEISYGLDSDGFDSSGFVRVILGLTSISGFEGSLPRKVGSSLSGFPLWLCRKRPSRQDMRSGDIHLAVSLRHYVESQGGPGTLIEPWRLSRSVSLFCSATTLPTKTATIPITIKETCRLLFLLYRLTQ